MNGLGRELPIDEVPIQQLEDQYSALAALIEERKEMQRRSQQSRPPSVPTNTIGRLKSMTWVAFLLMVAVALYNYIIINDLSMRPIDVAGLQKLLMSVIVYFMALLVVERSLKYFVPYIHHYFLNDKESEQDFSTHLKHLESWQLVCVTCFFIGLFFWGFVTVLGVKW
jgi:hypothetical protein